MHVMRSNAALLAFVAWLLVVGSCDASHTSPEIGPRQTPALVDLEPRGPIEPPGPREPSVVVYATTPERRAYVYRPDREGRVPAVVYNHGSEEHPSNFSGQARFFLPHGYAVVVPHRRGHGLSAAAARYPREVLGSLGAEAGALVRVIEEELDDVAAAVRYARQQPFVDPERVFVVGCSIGGVEALLMAERGEGLRAAVDFAGGSMAWSRDSALRERMTLAARRAQVPVFFLQAANDFDTSPTTSLAEVMRAAGRPVRSRVFSAVGTSASDGHSFCAGGDAPTWGADVLDFLESAAVGVPADTP